MNTTYTRRQSLAIERPAERDPENWMSVRDPFLRETRMVDHGGTQIQLVSILTVDLDDQPVWHARVGFLQAHDSGAGDGDFFLPLRMWTVDLEQAALRELNELTRLPREVEKFTQGVRPAGRPTNVHRFIRLSELEKSWLLAVQCGGVKPSVRAVDPGDRMRH